MPLLETCHGTLFYAQRGSTLPSLVCIHGAGGTHQHWGLQLQALSHAAQVFLLDLPGHGRSPGPGRARIAAYSQIVVAALDALGLNQVVLAGHSMGGAIALWTALTAPERIAELILVGTGARLPIMPVLFKYLEQEPARAANVIVEHAYGRNTAPALRAAGEESFRQVDPQVFRGDLLACNAFNVMERLDEIRCPTLILCGAEDRITPPKFSRYLHVQIHGSTLVLMPNAGHMVQIEQPDVVNATLRQFITAAKPSG